MLVVDRDKNIGQMNFLLSKSGDGTLVSINHHVFFELVLMGWQRNMSGDLVLKVRVDAPKVPPSAASKNRLEEPFPSLGFVRHPMQRLSQDNWTCITKEKERELRSESRITSGWFWTTDDAFTKPMVVGWAEVLDELALAVSEINLLRVQFGYKEEEG